jgi:3-deoxy-manno-octulosonate cytidylyltransferase (CMP-KDO synthetase)
MMNYLGIIPARFASTRFPGKPLANIHGKTMIQCVYEQAKKAIDDVVVATDDDRIASKVRSFGGQVVMTAADHQSGTDRCFEALHRYQELASKHFEVIINIQGDEPFIQPEQINLVKTCFNDDSVDIATLVKKIDENSIIFDPNKVKVVVNKKMEAMYFSRSPVPHMRNTQEAEWKKHHTFFLHIGMYAYRASALEEISSLEQSSLELAESLEQLRWLENGLKIKTAETQYESFGIDTPEDLEQAINGM